jgi:hypothetical protein
MVWVLIIVLITAAGALTALTASHATAAAKAGRGAAAPLPVATVPTALASATASPNPTFTVTPDATGSPGVPSPQPTAVPTLCASGFSDVQPSDWFYGPVQWMVCGGLVSGYSDGTFRPGNNATRSQIAKIVVLAAGWPLQDPQAPAFVDVPPGSAFYNYVETAFNHGIISGYDDGTFRPGNNVTRGQLCKIVVLARGWTLSTPSEPTFSDVPADSPFFSYVETAAYRAVVSGYGDGTFRPGNLATRAQLSKIVQVAFTSPQ